jgi:prepilin-type N-terminal cleavage/methylation domain-containing protein
MHQQELKPGFSLTELLIALVILGLIAAFTIPKVLSSQQNSQYKSEAKEAMSMISGAFQAYSQVSQITASTSNANLTTYMNYVAIDTSTLVNWPPGWGSGFVCGTSSSTCFRLHNGGILYFWLGTNFGSMSTSNAIDLYFDPDGNGANSAVRFILYTNGRVTDYGSELPGTLVNNTPENPDPSATPTWFSWN